jgi:hypothetical protein
VQGPGKIKEETSIATLPRRSRLKRKTAPSRPHDGYARANQLSRFDASILWEWRALQDIGNKATFRNKHHMRNLKVDFRALNQLVLFIRKTEFDSSLPLTRTRPRRLLTIHCAVLQGTPGHNGISEGSNRRFCLEGGLSASACPRRCLDHALL